MKKSVSEEKKLLAPALEDDWWYMELLKDKKNAVNYSPFLGIPGPGKAYVRKGMEMKMPGVDQVGKKK